MARSDQVRRGGLDTAGFTPSAWVQPQWGNVALFLLLLLAAVATIVWMVLVLARTRTA